VKIVVDTNIVFSALINPNGTISDILLNSQGVFDFYSPDSLHHELLKHRDKLVRVSKLSESEIDTLQPILLDRIEIITLEAISTGAWKGAFEILMGLDEYDAPFIALSLDLEAKLWTGDNKLMRGLKSKGNNAPLNTSEMVEVRNKLENQK